MLEPDALKIIPFLSEGYTRQIKGLGRGVKLFHEIDQAQHEEEIGPMLAEALRKTLTAKGRTEVGSLEKLAMKGGVRYAVSQFEGMLESAGKAMEMRGEGNKGDIMLQWLDWINRSAKE